MNSKKLFRIMYGKCSTFVIVTKETYVTAAMKNTCNTMIIIDKHNRSSNTM